MAGISESEFAVRAGARAVAAPVGVHGKEVRLAPPGGPFVPKQCTASKFNGEACQSFAAKGTPFCAGHLKQKDVSDG